MGELKLTYTRDDEPNRSGDLNAVVQVGDFQGYAQTYVAEESLSDFAGLLATYPMPKQGVTFKGLRDIRITVTPLNSRGHLRVSVELSQDLANGVTQQANLQLVSDYAGIGSFREALLAMLAGSASEAVLVGEH